MRITDEMKEKTLGGDERPRRAQEPAPVAGSELSRAERTDEARRALVEAVCLYGASCCSGSGLESVDTSKGVVDATNALIDAVWDEALRAGTVQPQQETAAPSVGDTPPTDRS